MDKCVSRQVAEFKCLHTLLYFSFMEAQKKKKNQICTAGFSQDSECLTVERLNQSQLLGNIPVLFPLLIALLHFRLQGVEMFAITFDSYLVHLSDFPALDLSNIFHRFSSRLIISTRRPFQCWNYVHIKQSNVFE